MNTYFITRDNDNKVQCLVRQGSKSYPLPHKMHHSPTGFEIGYGGSGPAELAMSILADVYRNESPTIRIMSGSVPKTAWDFHQEFKWKFLADKQVKIGETFEISEDLIKAYVYSEKKARL